MADPLQSVVPEGSSGTFHIHPGAKAATEASFRLPPMTAFVHLDFGLRTLSPECERVPGAGVIRFDVRLNGIQRFSQIVDRNHDGHIEFSASGHDRIDVAADPAGDPECDWGRFNIQIRRSRFNTVSKVVICSGLCVFAVLLAFSRAWLLSLCGAFSVTAMIFPAWKLQTLESEGGVAAIVLTSTLLLATTLLSRTLKSLRSVLAAFASVPLFAVPLVELVYFISTKRRLSDDQAYAIMQSNLHEAWIYLATYWPWYTVLAIIAPTLIYGTALARGLGFLHNWSTNSWHWLSVFLGFFSLTALTAKLPMVSMARGADYIQELIAWRQLSAARTVQAANLDATRHGSNETLIVVIGESANRDHLGIYGYARETTPKLSARDDLLIFTDAISSHSHTDRSLSLALTSSASGEERHFEEAVSLIELCRAAGIETHWISNQNSMGGWDNMVSVIADQAEFKTFIEPRVGLTNIRSHYDESLLPHVQAALARPSDRAKVIFVHLMGSHVDYCDRSPDAPLPFPPASLGMFGQAMGAGAKNLDCYDRSIAYTDSVLDRLLAQASENGQPSALIYLSDHGEDVFRKRGHDSAVFTSEMVEIPFLAWFSPRFAQAHATQIDAARKARTAPFMSDHLFASVLDLMGVQSKHVDVTHSIFSPLRIHRRRFTLNGKVDYDAANARARIEASIRNLSEADRDRVWVHRANTAGKASIARALGMRGHEMDVTLVAGRLQVGHDSATMSDLTLTDTLALLDVTGSGNIPRLWLDIKNASTANVDEFIHNFEAINGLKARALIEIGSVDSEMKRLVEAGYSVSYYLPTFDILAELGAGNEAALRARARSIAEQLRAQHITAVSFDARVYEFVRSYLTPLRPTLALHLWDLDLNLGDTAFDEKRRARTYWANPRVRTILVKLDTPFEL